MSYKVAILVAFSALVLAGCESEEEVRAKWVSHCAQSDFTAKQCKVLYGLKKDIAADADDREAAGLAAGMVMPSAISIR